LAILSQDGTPATYTAIRAKEGDMAPRSGSVTFPGPGKRGAFVMEFMPLPAETQTFSLTVNDQPILSGINLHHAIFRSF
jgi:hypothetical protein